MRIKGNVCWLFYLLFVVINIVLLELYIVAHQAGSGIGSDLYHGVALYYNDDKPKELLGYVIGIAIVFAFFVFYIVGSIRKKSSIRLQRKMASVSASMRFKWKNVADYMHFILIPIIILFFVKDSRMKVYLQAYIVLYLLFLTYRPIVLSRYESMTLSVKNQWYIVTSVMVVLIIQILYVFMNHIVGPPEIINEFYNIPESTKVGACFVDNTDYYNKHLFDSQGIKWDVEKNLYLSDKLRHDIEVSEKKIYSSDFIEKRGLNDEEKKFISDNTCEIHWQILGRYMFHHHSFVYVPVSYSELLGLSHEIDAQYGFGNIIIFRWLLSKMGGVSIDNWLKLNAWFYVVYYSVFAIVLFSVIDVPIYALSVFILSLVLLYLHGYEFIILAPGDSPWRHFVDIIILFLFFRIQKTEKDYLVYIALFLALFSVFANPQMGFMMSFAASISLLLYFYLKKMLTLDRVLVIIISFTVSIILVILFSSAGGLAAYYLKGVIGFQIGYSAMFYIFVFILCGYAVLVYLIKKDGCENCLSLLYLFFYSQGLLVYYVWHADINGLLARAHIYLLAISLFFYAFFKGGRRKLFVYGVIFLISMIIYINVYSELIREKKKYENIFETHKSYVWDFDRARIKSTADPLYFKDAVLLIKKYGSGCKKIYIISQYDNLLPFLAKKISAMPFHDLKWYNMTDRELMESIDLIRREEPEYLFVDRDINRDYKEEIISSSTPLLGYLHEESVWRAERLSLMALIFKKVSDKYVLVESGKLLSVYRRKEL